MVHVRAALDQRLHNWVVAAQGSQGKGSAALGLRVPHAPIPHPTYTPGETRTITHSAGSVTSIARCTHNPLPSQTNPHTHTHIHPHTHMHTHTRTHTHTLGPSHPTHIRGILVRSRGQQGSHDAGVALPTGTHQGSCTAGLPQPGQRDGGGRAAVASGPGLGATHARTTSTAHQHVAHQHGVEWGAIPRGIGRVYSGCPHRLQRACVPPHEGPPGRCEQRGPANASTQTGTQLSSPTQRLRTHRGTTQHTHAPFPGPPSPGGRGRAVHIRSNHRPHTPVARTSAWCTSAPAASSASTMDSCPC